MSTQHEYEPAERQPVGVHGAGGRKVLPDGTEPARAWVECEDSLPESRLLLAPTASPADASRAKARLQAGLTLAVRHSSTRIQKNAQTVFEKPLTKTKSQKRKDKLVAALRPPYFILTMVILMTALHVFGSEDMRLQLQWSPEAWTREPWRLVTYGWVHASAAHVALNALVGLAVGWRLEREQGWWRAALVWAGGVVAGALGAGALQPRVRVVGASAAVYALLTAHLPNVCLRFGHIPLWWFRLLSVAVLAASETSWALLRAPPPPPPARYDHVAWAAHIFGAAVGVPLAFLVFTGENADKRHVKWCRAASLALVAAGGATAILYYAHCARAPRGW